MGFGMLSEILSAVNEGFNRATWFVEGLPQQHKQQRTTASSSPLYKL